jgi:hypothetical protein
MREQTETTQTPRLFYSKATDEDFIHQLTGLLDKHNENIKESVDNIAASIAALTAAILGRECRQGLLRLLLHLCLVLLLHHLVHPVPDIDVMLPVDEEFEHLQPPECLGQQDPLRPLHRHPTRHSRASLYAPSKAYNGNAVACSLSL